MSEEILIERLAYGGEGLGFLNGKVCFVEGALPGERVLIDIRHEKKSFSKARLVEVLEPSAERIEPACSYYSECGGCQYQHVSYPEELKWKENQVRETFVRQLRVSADLIKPIQASPHESYYRNSVALHETIKKSPDSQVFGFFARNNKTVIPVDKCLLLDKSLQEVLGRKVLLKKGEADIQYKLSEKKEIFSDRKDHIFPIKIGDDSILGHSQCFFQNNLAVTAAVAKKIKDWVKNFQPKTFVDLFCGVGTFTVLSAADVPQKVCAEENVFALEALEENLKERGFNAEVLKGRAEKVFINYCKKSNFEEAMLLLDPPRQGLKPELTDFLAQESHFKHFVYLSCHMGTVIRDVQALIKNKAYQVEEIIPFDMFPRTKHVEVLVRLKKSL